MELKDFNIFNLSLQQKKLLKKKVGQGGGSTSDDDIAVFYVEDYSAKIKFTLIQGKPKVGEYEDLEPIICIDRYGNSYTYNISVLYDVFTLYKLDVNTLARYSYSNNKGYVNDFAALNIGDTLEIAKSELNYRAKYNDINLNGYKNFPSIPLELYNFASLNIFYNVDNNNYYVGHVTKIDKTNSNLYLSINNEIWKYTFTLENNLFTNITFVEVVQP